MFQNHQFLCMLLFREYAGYKKPDEDSAMTKSLVKRIVKSGFITAVLYKPHLPIGPSDKMISSPLAQRVG